MNGTKDPTDDGRQTKLPDEALARIGTRLRAHFSGAVVDPLPQQFDALLDALSKRPVRPAEDHEPDGGTQGSGTR